MSEPIETFTQIRYRCPTCRRSWSQRGRARTHIEQGCVSDVATRACKTCAYWRPNNPWLCEISSMPSGEWAIRHCPDWVRKDTTDE